MPKVINLGRRLNEDEINEIRTGKKTIYLYGRVEYEDAFKRRRFTNFRLGYSGEYPAPITACFNLCQKGNETERDT